ncbi:pirin family protein [Sphingobacterium suaedae]|uniref:Pirin family protein n=1 Tax=Sphingobacterium suaedae TaxID=1686402 RepID=A0ABW5KI15_9SPHI
METKRVEQVVRPGVPHFVGDGFRVHGFIANGTKLNMKVMDPFLVLDYNSKYSFPPSEIPKGVGAHPHKGFETVTIAYKGKVEHADSSGGGGIIAEGDVQWMTAGAGILHKEFHETNWSKKGGEFQMVQLWVNLPKKDKLTSPKYQALKNADFGRVPLTVGIGEVEVVAGTYAGISGPATTFSPVHIYNLRAKKGAKAAFSLPVDYTTMALVIEGDVSINDNTDVPTDHLALFERIGEQFTIEAKGDAVVLILSGQPLREPIAQYGPFVMNTQQELTEAFEEFQTGKFGQLKD